MKISPFRAARWLLFCCAAACARQASAEVIAVFAPAADTTLRETEPANNYGSAANVRVGASAKGTPRNRGLFRFDLSSIPSSAVINSAKLRFVVAQAGPDSQPASFELHRLLKDWGEGKQPGLLATTGEATWNSRFYQQSTWGAGGGQSGTDFVATPSAVATLAEAGTSTEFNSPELVADVQRWVSNAAPNYGWMLMAQGELPDTGKQVGARENLAARPILEVHYSAFVIYDFAHLGNHIRFSFDVRSNHNYTVESRGTFGDGDWTTLTNIPPQPADATIHITNSVSSGQGYFRLSTPDPALLIYDVARVESGLRFSFNIEANSTYIVEYRDSGGVGIWTALTNIPAFPINSAIHVTNAIASPQRFFRVHKP